MVILRAVTLLRSWEHEPLFYPSMVVLLLGALLALGGGSLVLRGRQYGAPPLSPINPPLDQSI
jgi:hypothetical protein